MYKRKILNLLVDKYESSKSFIGENKVNQSFSIKPTSVARAYDDDAQFEVFYNLNEDAKELESMGFVSIKPRSNSVIDRISLNVENITLIYEFLTRQPKIDLNQALLQIFEEARTSLANALVAYSDDQIQRIKANKSIRYFNGDIDFLKDVIKAIEEAYRLDKETYIRDFSMMVFKDSKRFEKIVETFKAILYEYGDFNEKDSILEELNIIKTPTYVNCKGPAIIKINHQVINLSAFNGDIGFSTNTIKEISNITLLCDKIVTVENLTSFYNFDSEDCFVIYLGGFHNTVRRNFLKLIYSQNSSCNFYHFGDIDAGGFLILSHLSSKTDIPFKPLMMGVKELEENRDFWKTLSSNDIQRLKGMIQSHVLDDEILCTISFMLENNCKLEQEAITLNKNR